ncbi:hypothetical protein HZS_991 [Henneguya salminicola]|nr:hypothetical protein HZS_991 [Henneguya salminicola]
MNSNILFDSRDCFESDPMGRRRVVICLWYIARYFYQFGCPVPNLIAFEMKRNRKNEDSYKTYIEYKKQNKSTFDVYDAMKQQMPDFDIEDYKIKSKIQEKNRFQKKIESDSVNYSNENVADSGLAEEVTVYQETIEEIASPIQNKNLYRLCASENMMEHVYQNTDILSDELEAEDTTLKGKEQIFQSSPKITEQKTFIPSKSLIKSFDTERKYAHKSFVVFLHSVVLTEESMYKNTISYSDFDIAFN